MFDEEGSQKHADQQHNILPHHQINVRNAVPRPKDPGPASNKCDLVGDEVQ